MSMWNSFRKWFSRRRQSPIQNARPERRRNARPLVELLEDRIAPAYDVMLDGSVLTITQATAGNASQLTFIQSAGGNYSFTDAGGLTFNAATGDGAANVTNSGSTITVANSDVIAISVQLGDGNDTFNFGNMNGNTIDPINVHAGGDASDAINVNSAVTATDTVTLRHAGTITVNSALTTTGTGSIGFNNASTVDLNADLSAATQITMNFVTTEVDLAQDVDLIAGVHIGIGDVAASVASLDLSGAAGKNTFTVTGGIGTVVLGTAVTDSGTPDELEINASGGIGVNSIDIANLLDIHNDTNTTGANSAGFGAVTAGSITGVGGTDNDEIWVFNGAVTTNAVGGMTISGGQISTLSTITANAAGPISLTADEIDLSGAVTGTAGLTLQPITAALNIEIVGGAPAAGLLDLTAAELANLTNGFSGITIGRSNGTGLVNWAGAVTFLDNVTLIGGTITGTGTLTSTGNSVTLTARTGGIGASGSPATVDATNLTTTSAGADQFLAEANSITIQNVNNSAGGTPTLRIDGGTFSTADSHRVNDTFRISVAAGATLNFVNTEHIPALTVESGTGAGSTVSFAGSSTITGDVTSNVTGTGATAASITGDFGLPAGAHTFTVNDDTTAAVDLSVAANVIGAGGLTKAGAGTLRLSGTDTYAGATTINTGTIALAHASNNNITSSATIDIASGAFLNVAGLTSSLLNLASGQTLQGKGTVSGGAVAALSGSFVAPGASTGILNTGNVTLESGSTFSVEVNNSTPGTGHDQLNVTGSVTINGAILTTSGTVTSSPGQSIVLINNDSTDTILGTPGTFTGRAEGSTVTINGVNFILSYVGGAGANDVTLTEPGAVTYTGDGTGENFEFRRIGDSIQFLRNGLIQYAVPISAVTEFIVNGADGSDTLLINYGAAGGFFGTTFTFNGQTNTTGTGDKLTVSGSSFTSLEYDATGAGAGTLTFAGNSATINFTGLEPVVVTSSLGTVTIDVDNGGVDAFATPIRTTITDAAGANMMVSFNVGAENITFTTPTVALNILGDNDHDDIIDIISVDGDGPFRAALDVNGQGGTDTVSVNTSLTLGSTTSAGTLTISANEIRLNAASIATDGDTTNGDAGSVTFNGPVVLDADVSIDTDAANADGAVLFNGTVNASRQHTYTLINTPLTWAAAVAQAPLDVPGGYLATVRSLAERMAVQTVMSAGGVTTTLLGGTDEVVEGEWRWATGPDLGIQFWSGGPGGSAVGGEYTSWGSGEPNNLGDEDYLQMDSTGPWNDGSAASTVAYVVEAENGAADSRALSLTSGSANVSFVSAVGTVAPLASITVNSANDVTFSNTVETTGNVTQAAGTGLTTFNGTSGTGIGGTLSIDTDAITLSTATLNVAADVVLLAQNAITQNSGADIDAGASTVSISANRDNVGGQDFLQDTASILTTNTTALAVNVVVNGSSGLGADARISYIGVGTGGRITITANGGAIVDEANDSLADIGAQTVGTTAEAVLVAADGIGTAGNPFDISVTSADLINRTLGGIFVIDTEGGLTLEDVDSNGFTVFGVGGDGTIRASSPLTISADAITTGGMTYTAADSATNDVDHLTVTGSGTEVRDDTALTLNAGDDLIIEAGTTVEVTGLLSTLALNIDAAGGGPGDTGGETAFLYGTIATGGATIQVTGGGQADAFIIDSNGAVGAPDANDGGTVDNVQDDVLITGGGGADSLTLDDSGDTTQDTAVAISDAGSGDGAITGLTPAEIAFVDLTTVTINFGSISGAANGDTVTVTPNAVTEYNLNGNSPTDFAGDHLIYDGSGAKSITGPNSGTISGTSVADVNFTSFERVSATGGNVLDDVLDLTSASIMALGSQDTNPNSITVQRSAADPDYLEIYFDGDTTDLTNPVLISSQLEASVNSLHIIGGTDADDLIIDDVNGLPFFQGSVPSVANNPNITGAAGLLFDGGDGNDSIHFVLNQGNTDQTYAMGNGIGGGSGATASQGEILTDNGTNSNLIYFTGLEPITTSGAPGGTLTVLGDTNANVITIQAGAAGFTDITATNPVFETFSFAANAFTALEVYGMGDGDTIDLTSLDVLEISLATIRLDGDTDTNTDASADTIIVRSSSSLPNTSVINLFGGEGNDVFRLGSTGSTAGTTAGSTVDGIAVAVNVSVGDDAAAGDQDTLTVDDNADASGDTVEVTSTTIDGITGFGAAGIDITYANLGGVAAGPDIINIFEGSGDDTTNIQGTNAFATYNLDTDPSTGGGDDSVNISSTAPTVNGNGTLTGDLNGIDGPININTFGNGAGTGDTINVSNFGGSVQDYTLELLGTGQTRLSEAATAFANITYDANGTTGQLEHFTLTGSNDAGNGDVYNIDNTTATSDTIIRDGDATVGAGNDNATFNINGDNLSANNTFQGFDGVDQFILNITGNIGDNAVAGGAIASVVIEGGAASDSVNRDRLTINDGNSSVRQLDYRYLTTQGDINIGANPANVNAGLFGANLASGVLQVRTMETLRFFDDGSSNDIVRVFGANTAGTIGGAGAVNDILTVALIDNNTSALVFKDGTPYLSTPPATLAGSRPGLAGGGTATDLYINGLDANAGIILHGNGNTGVAGTGDRAVVQARSEADLVDGANTTDIFGFGAGILQPGALAGNAYDTIDVTDARVITNNNSVGAPSATGNLTEVFLSTASFVQSGPAVVTQQAALIVNGGDEAVPQASGIADDITATVSANFNIQVNGNLPDPATFDIDGLPRGDQLNINGPGAVNIFSDKASPPNVTTTFGNSVFGVLNSSIERLRLTPSNGVVNLIGDNNDATVDQTDNFVVRGRDIDSGGSLDDGIGEMTVVINGSNPILLDGVQTLNVFGYDLTGQNLNNPDVNAIDTTATSATDDDIDTLDITAWADNSPRSWGIHVNFNEGSPAGSDGAQADLLIYNTVAANPVSENIVVAPSGPEDGELQVTNAAFGTPIVTINYVDNLDIVVNDNDGFVSDTDTLTLRGTDPGSPNTSGQERFVADFTATGDATNPMVQAFDTLGTAATGDDVRLFNLRTFTNINTISFELLGADDSISIIGRNNGSLTINVDGGNPAGSDAIVLPGTLDATDSYIVTPGATSDTGVILVQRSAATAATLVNFTATEAISIDGGGGAGADQITLNGAGDKNAFTLNATAIRAGNARVDAGPTVNFTALGSTSSDITLNGLGGDDVFSVTHFNGWGIDDVTINGGAPDASDSFQLLTHDPGTLVDDTIAYSANTANSGQLDVTSSGVTTNYILTGIESARVDASTNDGPDILNVTTTNAVITPGFAKGSGLIQPVDANGQNLLPLSYLRVEQTTVTGATAIIQGSDENDTISVNATTGEVTFTNLLGQANTVDLFNNAAPAGFTRVVVNGLGGDDSFSVTSGALFTNGVQLVGGEPGAGSDSATVTGAAGNDTIGVDLALSQVTGIIGGTIALDGIEHLTVNGNGAAAGDTISLTSLGSVTGLASITVNANNLAGDRVSVSGTAGPDTLNFNPADANSGQVTHTGTTAVVNYANVNNAASTLTIGGGTGGFDVLAVLGTEGADTVTSTATTVTRDGTVTVGAGIDRIDINSLGGDDTITLATLPEVSSGGVDVIVNAGSGNDNVNATGLVATIGYIFRGDGGNDTLLGGQAGGRLEGGDGNDSIDGNGGADQIFGGAGSDLITWDHGDGSDLVEGGDDIDQLLFNGATSAQLPTETFTLSATDPTAGAGSRLSLQRTQGTINMDVAGVEDIVITASSGVDSFQVNDLTPTDVRTVNINVGSGSGSVRVAGRNVADDLVISSTTNALSQPIIKVAGLRYDVNIISPTTASSDTLRVDGNSGDDSIKADAGVEASIGITLDGGLGKDFLSADATLLGGAGDDILEGGAGPDTYDGGAGEDTLIASGGNDSFTGGDDFDTILVRGTAGNDTISINQNAAATLQRIVNGTTHDDTLATVEALRVEAGNGADLIVANWVDSLGIDGATNSLRLEIVGGEDFAQDRLAVSDDGLSDLTLIRHGAVPNTGTVTIGPGNAEPLFLTYEQVERVDITPLNALTGATGADGAGRIVTFHADPFEFNDSRLNAGQLVRVGQNSTSPTIDPGGIKNPIELNGDEDWYEFRPQTVNTYQIKILFDRVGTLTNGRAGLPATGDLTLEVFDATGTKIPNALADQDGQHDADGNNRTYQFAAGPVAPYDRIFVRVKGLGDQPSLSINSYDFDNLAGVQPGVSLLDTVGPQVTGVSFSGQPFINIFAPKPIDGPSPLVQMLDIFFADPPFRAPGLLYPAIDPALFNGDDAGNQQIAPTPALGLFKVVGDRVGNVPIVGISLTNDAVALNNFASATVRLFFDTTNPLFEGGLPDDRYTLTILDGLTDPAGNTLDGESNAAQPNSLPSFPSGNNKAGGNFVARFTVNSRPHLGTFGSGKQQLDINGNAVWDPNNLDIVNADKTFTFGLYTDAIFAGNFAPSGQPQFANGFDKLGAYGMVNGQFRFLLATSGVIDTPLSVVPTLQINGRPVAFDFNPNIPGDEIAVFDGKGNWYIDFNHNNNIGGPGTIVVRDGLRGYPIAGDFDGNGSFDLATYQPDTKLWQFDLHPLTNPGVTVSTNFGWNFPGVMPRPVAHDMNQDGITDVGLFVPTSLKPGAATTAEWYFLQSPGPGNVAPGQFTGTINALNHTFNPTPFTQDHHYDFGSGYNQPIVGIWDPPAPAGPPVFKPASGGPFTNVSVSALLDQVPAGGFSGLAARRSTDGKNLVWGGIARSGNSYSAQIRALKNGVWQTLASTPMAPLTSRVNLKFDVVGTTLELFVNGNLTVSATNTSQTATGSAGNYSSAGTFIWPPQAAAISRTPSTLPFNTGFTQLDGRLLDSAWDQWQGSFRTQGNVLISQSANNMATVYSASQTDVAQSINIVALPPGESAGLTSRFNSATDSLYRGSLRAVYQASTRTTTYSAEIWRKQGATWLKLASSPVSAGAGSLTFVTVGASQQLFWNGALVAASNDTALKSGSFGIFASQGVALDDYAARKLTFTTTSLPFTDPFATGNAPSANWYANAGGFAVANNRITGIGSLNQISLFGVKTLNVALQAEISFAVATSASAGLVARYDATTGNRYWAGIVATYNTSTKVTTYVAQIQKRVNGVTTVLFSKAVAKPGLMQFSVTGAQITMSLNGLTLASIRDTSLSVAGGVGLLGGKGSQFSSFSAT